MFTALFFTYSPPGSLMSQEAHKEHSPCFKVHYFSDAFHPQYDLQICYDLCIVTGPAIQGW